jgi:hypothetical protein
MDTGNSKASHIAKIAFVYGVVFFCLGVAALMGFDVSLTGKVADTVADGLISLAMFVSVSYLATHTVDTSGILNKVASRIGGRTPLPAPLPDASTTQTPTETK